MNTLSKSSQNPYVGPRPFKTHENLYGRDWERENLLDLLIAERLVMLYSPSGAGKSSLIQAALIPDLEKEGFTVLPVIRVGQEPPLLTENRYVLSTVVGKLIIRRASTPLLTENRYVLSTLLSLEQRPDMPEKERIPPEALTKLDLAGYLEERQATLKDKHTVFIFDQFEEILTVDPTDQPIKENFFKEIGKVLRDRNYWALFALREDRIAGLDPFLDLVPTRLKTTFRLNFLEEKAASEAIKKPAKDHHINFTDDAAKKLIKDLQTEQIQQLDGSFVDKTGIYIEPVQLQVVCRRLWETLPADTKSIEADAIETVGTVDQALIDYYNEQIIVIVAETKISEREIRDWCDKKLITPQGIRSQVQRGQNQGLEDRAINALIGAHLVRSENHNNINWYELAHDRLIKPIQKANTKWRDNHLNILQRQADQWEKEGRPDGLLLRDSALKKAEHFSNHHHSSLSPNEKDFLKRCQEVRKRTLKLICLSFTALIVGALAVIFAICALYLYQKSSRNESLAKANESLAKAGYAKSILNVDQMRSLIAAINAVQLSLEPRFTKDDSLDQVKLTLLHVIKGVREIDRFSGYKMQISAIAIDPNAKDVISLYKDGELRLWCQNKDKIWHQNEEKVLPQQNGATTVAISIYGRAVVRKTENKWQVWSRSDNSEIFSFDNLSPDSNQKIAISRDGKTVVAGGADGRIQLWSLDDQRTVIQESFHHDGNKKISSLAIGLDGQTVVSGDEDGSIQVWSRNHEKVYCSFLQRDGLISNDNDDKPIKGIQSLSISDDGKIASGGKNFVQLWSPDCKEKQRDRRFHRGVNSVAISSDGGLIVSGSYDYVRLWSPFSEMKEQPNRNAEVLPHKKVTAVAVSLDGKIVASGDEDGVMMLWSRDSLWPLDLDDKQMKIDNWKNWLLAACTRLRGHSIWNKSNRTETEQGAVDEQSAIETCKDHFPEQMK